MSLFGRDHQAENKGRRPEDDASGSKKQLSQAGSDLSHEIICMFHIKFKR